MKSFKNNIEFFSKTLHPDVTEHRDNVNAFNLFNQKKFNEYIIKLGADESGEITKGEIAVIEKIKSDIEKLKKENPGIDTERLEFDLAYIFHSNLKNLNWGRHLLNDFGMWRWLSMNYFLKEVFWRRGKKEMKKKQVLKSAKLTYNHLVGIRTRDIFPRRYFLLGARLYDKHREYELLNKLAKLSKEGGSGGFGNLILNLLDTKLISPNDYVAKTISELLFTQGKLAADKEVVRAFVRYNGFKKRLLIKAPKEIFEKEICIG
jgi:hypothetical protein